MDKRTEKAGVVTLFGMYNYGNRLQNYAVHQILMQEGLCPETIRWYRNPVKELLKALRCIVGYMLKKPEYIREYRFREFDKKYLRKKAFFTKDGQLSEKIAGKYEYFVVGSDQVWNPEVRRNEKNNFFLQFCRREQRIALSPSYALDIMPIECEPEYIIGLQGFPYLSCREKKGSEIISKLTNRVCENLIDPSLVLDKSEWLRFAKKIDVPDKYAVVFFLGEISSSARDRINHYTSEIKCEILEPSSCTDKYYALDPREFVYLISHADIVFTDSFHTAAFSINLNVPFYIFERHQDYAEAEHMMSRMYSLLDITGFKDRIDEENKHFDNHCSFDNSNRILDIERGRFRTYLKKCLKQKMIKPFCLPDKNCTGCGACAEKCKIGCLCMREDAEGFLRPFLQTEKCVNCGACLQVCPVIKDSYIEKDGVKRKLFAAYQMDVNELKQSSSGAVFPLLARYVINHGGAVYGASFTEDFRVEHIRVDCIEQVDRLRGSKYVQSNVCKIYKMVSDDLKNHKPVLFVGTPCEVGGLKAFLGQTMEESEDLYTVDFVCHGVPSPGIWKKYLRWLELKFLQEEKIRRVNFRKKDGTLGTVLKLSIEAEHGSYESDSINDPYYRAFLNNVSLRKSCYRCKFKGVERRCDITLGDFWGIEQIQPNAKNELGTSLVLVHSEKGSRLMSAVMQGLKMSEIDIREILDKHNIMLTESCTEHPYRRQFFNDKENDYQKLADKYCVPKRKKLFERVISKIRRILK